MTGIPLKAQQGAEKSPSKQRIGTELLYNYRSELDFRGFSWELLTRHHNADSLLFSTLFMDEQERFQVFKAFCKT